MNDPADPRIAALTQAVIRSTRLMRTIGLDPMGLSLAIAFQDATRPWTARALADYICYPRTSVVKRLREYGRRGVVRRSDDGWEICPDSQELVRRMLLDYIDLLGGYRVGFSPEVVEFCKASSADDIRPARRQLDDNEALTISFPRGTTLLNYPGSSQ